MSDINVCFHEKVVGLRYDESRSSNVFVHTDDDTFCCVASASAKPGLNFPAEYIGGGAIVDDAKRRNRTRSIPDCEKHKRQRMLHDGKLYHIREEALAIYLVEECDEPLPEIKVETDWHSPAGDARRAHEPLAFPTSSAARDLLFPHSALAITGQRSSPGLSFVTAERVDPAQCGGEFVIRLRGSLGRRFVNWYGSIDFEWDEGTTLFDLNDLVYKEDDPYDHVQCLSSDKFVFADPPEDSGLLMPSAIDKKGNLVYGIPRPDHWVERTFISDQRDQPHSVAHSMRPIIQSTPGLDLSPDERERLLKGRWDSDPIVGELRPDDQESRLEE